MDHSILGWIFIGIIAGWLAGVITHGGGFGLIADLFLGLIGAVLGGWIFSKLGIAFGGWVGSLAAATVGAVTLVGAARLVARPSS